MGLRTINRILIRALIVCLAIFAGIMYADATNMFGMTGLRVNNNMIIANNFTWNGSQGATPRGAMIFWDATTCPTGWTQVTALNTRFPRGASSYGTTGGASSHSHTSSHTHGMSGYSISYASHTHNVDTSISDTEHGEHSTTGCGVTDAWFDFYGCANVCLDGGSTDDTSAHGHTSSTSSSSGGGHSHNVASGSLSGTATTSSVVNSLPAYYNLTLCRKW